MLIILERIKKLMRNTTSIQFVFPSKIASSNDRCIPNRTKMIKEEKFDRSIIVFLRSEKTPL